jgi:hypothetical protein
MSPGRKLVVLPEEAVESLFNSIIPQRGHFLLPPTPPPLPPPPPPPPRPPPQTETTENYSMTGDGYGDGQEYSQWGGVVSGQQLQPVLSTSYLPQSAPVPVSSQPSFPITIESHDLKSVLEIGLKIALIGGFNERGHIRGINGRWITTTNIVNELLNVMSTRKSKPITEDVIALMSDALVDPRLIKNAQAKTALKDYKSPRTRMSVVTKHLKQKTGATTISGTDEFGDPYDVNAAPGKAKKKKRSTKSVTSLAWTALP